MYSLCRTYIQRDHYIYIFINCSSLSSVCLAHKRVFKLVSHPQVLGVVFMNTAFVFTAEAIAKCAACIPTLFTECTKVSVEGPVYEKLHNSSIYNISNPVFLMESFRVQFWVTYYFIFIFLPFSFPFFSCEGL